MIDASPLLGKKIPSKIGSVIQNDLDVALFFLHTAGVAVVPGSGFGTDHCSFRVSCAKPKEQLIEAIQRMKDVIEMLK
jgi:aspartate/methionine/tyrosine aminotransferase